MLPEILSNDLCSLKENVDRMAFSAVFDIKKETGEILNRWFGKTIINSNKGLAMKRRRKYWTQCQRRTLKCPSPKKSVFDTALQKPKSHSQHLQRTK